MIFGLVRMWVTDLLTQVPTGHNDLWLVRMLTFRNSEFLDETSFDYGDIIRRSAPRYFLVCGLAQVKCLSQGSPLKHDGRRKRRRREKNEQKGFKGSSTGPPGEEIPRVPLRDLRGEKINNKNLKKNKTGTYHWEKHIACFMHICNVRSQVFFPGVWVCLRDFILFIYFWQPWAQTFTVGKHLALRNPSYMGKFSRNTVGKPGPLRRGKRKHLWYREEGWDRHIPLRR